MLHPGEHRELEAKLKEPQSRVRLEAALTQLKSTMDAKQLHYEDLSGRPKNLCAFPTCFGGACEECSLTSPARVVSWALPMNKYAFRADLRLSAKAHTSGRSSLAHPILTPCQTILRLPHVVHNSSL